MPVDWFGVVNTRPPGGDRARPGGCRVRDAPEIKKVVPLGGESFCAQRMRTLRLAKSLCSQLNRYTGLSRPVLSKPLNHQYDPQQKSSFRDTLGEGN
jgi:hypothetical protein